MAEEPFPNQAFPDKTLKVILSECPTGARTVHVPLTAQNTGLFSSLLAPAGNEITLLNSVTGYGM